MKSNLSKIAQRLYRSVPLMPVFITLYVFILLLSPTAWNGSQLCYSMILVAIGLGVISAYSTTLFFDGYLKYEVETSINEAKSNTLVLVALCAIFIYAFGIHSYIWQLINNMLNDTKSVLAFIIFIATMALGIGYRYYTDHIRDKRK